MCTPDEYAEIMRFQTVIFTIEICDLRAATPEIAEELIALAVSYGPSKIEQER